MTATRSDEPTAEVYSASVWARAGSYMGACLVFSSESKKHKQNENAVKCAIHETQQDGNRLIKLRILAGHANTLCMTEHLQDLNLAFHEQKKCSQHVTFER